MWTTSLCRHTRPSAKRLSSLSPRELRRRATGRVFRRRAIIIWDHSDSWRSTPSPRRASRRVRYKRISRSGPGRWKPLTFSRERRRASPVPLRGNRSIRATTGGERSNWRLPWATSAPGRGFTTTVLRAPPRRHATRTSGWEASTGTSTAWSRSRSITEIRTSEEARPSGTGSRKGCFLRGSRLTLSRSSGPGPGMPCPYGKRAHERQLHETYGITHGRGRVRFVGGGRGRTAQRVVVMNQARIEQTGTPEEVFHHPASEFVRTSWAA